MTPLRPTLQDSDKPGLDYRSTYFRVLEATASVRGLIHGQLDAGSKSCAIGTYFRQSQLPIDATAIDEIAAYNDSFPYLTEYERWKKVRKWLKFKVSKMK